MVEFFHRHKKSPMTLLLFMLAISFAGCSEEKPVQDEEVARPVRYVTLAGEEKQFSRRFSGTAKASKESALSFKVSGTVQSIDVTVGDPVKKGTLLATLDKTDLQVDVEASLASLKASQADVKAAETKVNTTRSNYARIEKLYETDNVSLSEFEQARGDFETAKAQLQATKSQVNTSKSKLQASKNQLEYAELHAPFEGIVNSIDVEENEEVNPGSPILTLSGISNLEVVVNLSDLYIAKVERGMKTKVIFPTIGGEAFEGNITEIPYATTDAPTYPVTIAIHSQDKRLRPGMSAEIYFDFDQAKRGEDFYLPADAVGEDSTGNFVFLIERQDERAGVARKRHISVGALSEKGFLVKEGVTGGDVIATSGLQLLLDGMNVVLLDDPVQDW